MKKVKKKSSRPLSVSIILGISFSDFTVLIIIAIFYVLWRYREVSITNFDVYYNLA